MIVSNRADTSYFTLQISNKFSIPARRAVRFIQIARAENPSIVDRLFAHTTA